MPVKYPHTEAELKEHKWEETTEDHYYDMLGAVPPFLRSGSAFAVGEGLCQLNDGTEVNTMFIVVDGRYYTKPDKIKDFDAKKYTEQVRHQLNYGQWTKTPWERLVAAGGIRGTTTALLDD
jgi:hypothetical protein